MSNAVARGERRAVRRAERIRRVFLVVVVAEFVAIAGLGVWTVQNEYFNYGDEMVHFSYTKFIADHGRLPVLGRDVVTQEVLGLNRDVHGGDMVCLPGQPNREMGLCGIYESFQPPLYYLLTVPVYAAGRAESLGGSPHRAFMAMRYFGVLMLLLGACLTLVLVWEVAGPADALPLSALALVVFLLPGTVVRFATLANAVLELPLALGLTILLWRAWTRDSTRALVGAAFVFALCLLTKLTLAPLGAPLALTAAVLLYRRRASLKRAAMVVAATLAVPCLLLLPWLAFNHAHYDAWTGDRLARRIQAVVINPTNHPYDYDEIATFARDAIDRLAVPQEWQNAPDVDGGPKLRWALLALLAGIPLLIAIARVCGWRRRAPDDVLDPRGLALLVTPIVAAIGFLAVEMHDARWPVMLTRYFLFAFPLLVVFGVLQWRALLGTARWFLALSVTTGCLALGLWAVVAPHIPFA